jgi:hypothetical protein
VVGRLEDVREEEEERLVEMLEEVVVELFEDAGRIA